MKRIFLFILVAILSVSIVATFSLTGCKEKETAVAEETVEEETEVAEEEVEEAEEGGAEEPSIKGKKVGVVLSWATHEWYVSVMDGFKAQTEELGIEYTIVDGEGDVGKGVSVMENFVQEGVDGILLFASAATGYEAGIDAAYNAGIPVILDPRDMPGTNITAFGSNENFNMTRETGLAVAKYIKENWPEDKEVNVLTVTLPALPEILGRTDGFLIGLLEGGIDFNWAQEVDGQGNLPTSLDAAVVAFTAHPEINIVQGINDDSMFGGYKAAEQQGIDLSEMIFIGTGLEGPKARQSILDDNAHKFDTAMFPGTQGYICKLFCRAI